MFLCNSLVVVLIKLRIFMFFKSKLLMCALSSLLLSSCVSHTMTIGVNSFVDRQELPSGFCKQENVSFFVIAAEQGNSLLEQEIAKKITKYLESLGYRIETPNKAKYLLIFTHKTQSKDAIENVPIFVPGNTVTTTGSHYNYYGFNTGSFTSTSSTPGTFSSVARAVTKNEFILGLYVYDYEKARELYKQENTSQPNPIWSGGACMISTETADIRTAVDYLIIVAFEYFGKSSNQLQMLNIDPKNKDIKYTRDNILNTEL